MRFILIIIAALFFTSCALPASFIPQPLKAGSNEPIKPLSLLMEEHRNLIICCKSFKEFGFERLSLPDSRFFNIDKNSMASSFNTGKSFFKAFTLPDFSSPYTVSIESYVQGKDLIHGYIFSPAIIFLNEDHQIVQTSMRGLFEYSGDEPAKPLTPGAALIGKINLTYEMRDYKYMIILTPGKTLGIAHEHSPTKKAPAAFTGKKVPLIHAPAGKLRIKLYKKNTGKQGSPTRKASPRHS